MFNKIIWVFNYLKDSRGMNKNFIILKIETFLKQKIVLF